ncbi:hypothetical protein BX600DRAFT_197752 [Xylariales sp. PMI_506]|nr:hypothetical protein BX600DRAFT_197752 [Xylariales sp. PMI_506]
MTFWLSSQNMGINPLATFDSDPRRVIWMLSLCLLHFTPRGATALGLLRSFFYTTASNTGVLIDDLSPLPMKGSYAHSTCLNRPFQGRCGYRTLVCINPSAPPAYPPPPFEIEYSNLHPTVYSDLLQ